MSRDNVEYWRWREYRLTVPGKKWENASVITLGVDVGSVSSKAAVMMGRNILRRCYENRLQQP
ncbi:MAG: hypothetical protein ACUVTE_03005 [Candidatus Bathycorpusculaceae bacterium]